MNIHEYQAKELMLKFGVSTPGGGVATTPEEAEKVAISLNSSNIVVKAQIHAGGRGKGTFTNGFKGGVQLCKTPAEAKAFAGKMIGNTLVTIQTGSAGRLVKKVLIAEAKDISRELYFAILMDRATGGPLVIASQRGGMDIEAVAHETPEAIFTETVHPLLGLQDYQCRKLAKQLGLSGKLLTAGAKLFKNLYKCFLESDCSMIEINPLVVTTDDQVMALDAKFNFDDNALYRHPDIAAYRDTDEEDPREVEASKFNLNYVGLDGHIACMVNGAGLAMATMDIIKYYGGEPANFLDVGGGANEQQVTEAFKILVADKNVKAILVNIFGGIMKCDVIAQGNVEAGKKLIRESGLPVTAADNLADAAQKVVAAVKSK
jgi:succinyl-CoA synthetase beta subunit